MIASQESTTRTPLIALVTCLVSSVFVAGTVVVLGSTQAESRLLDKQHSIFAIADLGEPSMSGKEVKALFGSRVIAKVVGLQSGTFSGAQDPLGYDPPKAVRDPVLSEALPVAEGIASIKRCRHYTTTYLVEAGGRLDILILPVCGYGLWSTLYGSPALKSDLNTIADFGFYQHGETPGLGGEVDNPKWKTLWVGKVLYDAQGDLAAQIIKGSVGLQSVKAAHQVDNPAGVTLTSKGIDNLLHFWLGKGGFDAFPANLCKKEA